MGNLTPSRELFAKLKDASSRDMPSLTVLLGHEYTSRYPEAGIGWLMYGIGLVEMARYEDARKALMQAVRFCPADKLRIPFSHLGHLHQQKGSLRAAARWYQKTIDADPKDASGHIYLGSVFALQGNLKDAIQCHRKATRCKKGCIDEAYLNLGLVLRAQGRLTQAKTALQKAIELDPEYAAAKEALVDVNGTIEYLSSRKKRNCRTRST